MTRRNVFISAIISVLAAIGIGKKAKSTLTPASVDSMGKSRYRMCITIDIPAKNDKVGTLALYCWSDSPEILHIDFWGECDDPNAPKARYKGPWDGDLIRWIRKDCLYYVANHYTGIDIPINHPMPRIDMSISWGDTKFVPREYDLVYLLAEKLHEHVISKGISLPRLKFNIFSIPTARFTYVKDYLWTNSDGQPEPLGVYEIVVGGRITYQEKGCGNSYTYIVEPKDRIIYQAENGCIPFA
jgi:hypothetical protein